MWNNLTNLSLLASQEINAITCAKLWWQIGAREYLTVEHYYLKSYLRYIEHLPTFIITGSKKWVLSCPTLLRFSSALLSRKIPLPFVLYNARDTPLSSVLTCREGSESGRWHWRMHHSPPEGFGHSGWAVEKPTASSGWAHWTISWLKDLWRWQY